MLYNIVVSAQKGSCHAHAVISVHVLLFVKGELVLPDTPEFWHFLLPLLFFYYYYFIF